MDMEAIKAFYVEPFLFGFVCAQKWMKDISMIAFHRDVDKNLYEFNWPGRPVIWTIVRSVIRQHVWMESEVIEQIRGGVGVTSRHTWHCHS